MNALVERLGWMLVHSIWEGAIIWVLLQVVLSTLHRRSAQARYLAAGSALGAMVVLPWLTFGSMDLSARLRIVPVESSPALIDSRKVIASTPAVAVNEASTPSPSGSSEVPDFPTSWRLPVNTILPWLVGAWLFGVTVFACRFWLSWLSVRRLAHLPLTALPVWWQQRLVELQRTAGVQALVRMGESALVVVPMVVGWLKPVILLPLGVLSRLPSEQVESILLHELAHIRRHDFLVNLLQSVVETLFFYHPAARSISRRIRMERELVCDDLSVQWCQDPVTYAEALATFEEFRRGTLTLAATGEGDLFQRIRRIVLGIEPRQQGCSLVAISGLVATGIYLASMFLAPLIAAEIMTDQERLAAIEAIQPHEPTLVPFRAPNTEVSISGILRTEDGQPLPKNLVSHGVDANRPLGEALFVSQTPNNTARAGLEFNKDSFFSNLINGDISLGIWTEGYAPLLMDHFRIEDGKVGPLSLILKRGFPARVRLLGADGKSLSGVKLFASTRPMTRYPEVGLPGIETDADGLATIGDVDANTVLSVSAGKTGWQSSKKVIGDWTPDRVISLTLQPAILTKGTIIDQANSKAVSGAIISMAAQSDPAGPITYDPLSAPLLGQGDDQGRFSLNSLNSDTSYNIYVKAPGYPYTMFSIQPGDPQVSLALTRGVRVHGRILDPQGLLKKEVARFGMPAQILCNLSIEAYAGQSWGYMLVQPLSKLGPVIPFSFVDLPRSQRVEFSAIRGAGTWYPVELSHDVDDCVIDLSKPPRPLGDNVSPQPQRSVEITFDAGKDHPAPIGNLDIQYDGYGDNPKVPVFGTEKSILVVNGRAKDSFYTPNKLIPNSSGLVGYWFKEQTFDLPAGSGPFRKTIEVLPAGVIHGKVTQMTSLRYKLVTATAIVIKPAPGLEGMELASLYASPQGSDHYVTHPLPFGGTYAVVLQQGPSTYAVSMPTVIDAEHPIVELDIPVAGDQILRGKFVDANNRPISMELVYLSYKPDGEASLAPTAVTRTALDGTFSVPSMNFQVPGQYELQLDRTKWAPNTVLIDSKIRQPVTIMARRQTSTR